MVQLRRWRGRACRVAVALGLIAGGCGSNSHSPKPARVALTGSPTPLTGRPAAPRRPAPAPVPVAPEAGSLRTSLDRLLAPAGPQTGALVFDMTARASVYAVRDRVGRPPASVEKLYTSVAALRELGPNARLTTTVLGTGHLGAGGIWHGNLYLRGDGDPSFGDGSFNRVWEQGYGPTAAQLAVQLRRDGIRRVAGALIADASRFDDKPGGPATDFAPDVPDYGGELSALTYDHGATIAGWGSPATFAAHELALTMRGSGVWALAAHRTGRTPSGARRLASVSSPPLRELLKLMDVPSDDLFADLLTEQLGSRFGTGGSIAAGARVIAGQIVAYGLHPTIVDGSGLSRADRSTPSEIVDLLRKVWRTPVGNVLRDALPIVGQTGTVASFGVKTPAQGHCIAKTGTLNFVTNLAGYCHTVTGRMVAFALFIDGPANWQAYAILSKSVAAIARY
jgi:serine-type D-Ala-D-Ala carboxypeptidase/endopeptidase (penicillin-binding protein 4)